MEKNLPQDSYDAVVDALGDKLELMRSSGVIDLALVRDCSTCSLGVGSAPLVRDAGIAPAPGIRVVFVTGAPAGEPQGSGEARELIDKMIAAMGLVPKEVYLTSALKCVPPSEHPTLVGDLASCRRLLEAELQGASAVVVALGPSASKALLGLSDVRTLRGRFHVKNGVKVMCTWGTGQMIERPELKKEAWADLKMVIRALDA